MARSGADVTQARVLEVPHYDLLLFHEGGSVGIASGNNTIGERHARCEWINRHSADGIQDQTGRAGTACIFLLI